MKKILFLFLFYIIFNALPAQTSINIRFGDSEGKGLFGTELQVSYISLSAGWRPAMLPIDKRIHSFSSSLTYYVHPERSSFYFSGCAATKSVIRYMGIGDYEPEPSMLLIVGYRSVVHERTPEINDRIMIDVGAGINLSKHARMFAFEALFNYKIIKLRR